MEAKPRPCTSTKNSEGIVLQLPKPEVMVGFGGEIVDVVELDGLEVMTIDELVDWEVVVMSGVELVTKPELELDFVVELVTVLVLELVFEVGLPLDFEFEATLELEDFFEVTLWVELEAGMVT